MSTHTTAGAPARGAQSGSRKCAVEFCTANTVPGHECCTVHHTEDEVIELAGFVQSELETRDGAGDLGEAIAAARELLERLFELEACRDVLARSTAASGNAA